MVTTSSRALDAGKFGRDTSNGGNRTICRLTEAVMRSARSLWPHKVAPELALRTDRSVRTAEHWLAGDRDIAVGDLMRLIESDVGLEVLDAFMQTIPVTVRMRWWDLQKLNLKLEAAERRASQSARERDQLRFDLGNGRLR